MSVPLIDLSPMGSPGGKQAGKQAVGDSMVAAAQEIGFFYITEHGIKQKLIDDALLGARQFFALPIAEKQKLAVNQQQRGWLAQGMCRLQGGETYDAKEIFFWGHSDPQYNQWGVKDSPAEFLHAAIMPYFSAMLGLGHRLMEALALGLGLPQDSFKRFYREPLGRGQLVYYPPLKEQERLQDKRFSAAPHTDFGVLTLLWQDDKGGLQAKARNDQWLAVPPIDGSFVCNIGDLLERWSNRRLRSTLHRVENLSGKERYSMPIFFDADRSAVIDPQDLGTQAAEALFEPIAAGDYIAAKNRRHFTHYGEIEGG